MACFIYSSSKEQTPKGLMGLSTELTDIGQRTASDSPESFVWSLLTYLMPS